MAVLSPRGGRLMTGQRVARARATRRVLRRAWRAAVRLAALLLAVGALGGAGLGVRWLLTAPRFAVSEGEVSGNSGLGREAILAAAGIVPATNLFRLDP